MEIDLPKKNDGWRFNPHVVAPEELYNYDRARMRTKGIIWCREVCSRLGLRYYGEYPLEELINFIQYIKHKDLFKEN
jgi:hypothetical protein